jgi:hypothetical protein
MDTTMYVTMPRWAKTFLAQRMKLGIPAKDIDSHILLCRKSLYGFRQSGNLWFKHVKRIFLEYGLRQTTNDPSMFVLPGRNLFVLLYVDDIASFGPDDELDRFLEYISSKLTLTVDRPIKTYLGIDFSYHKDNQLTEGVLLSQGAAVAKLIVQYASTENTKNSPLPTTPLLAALPGSETNEKVNLPYREIVGAVNYLNTCTRPDLCYSVNQLARFFSSYTTEHHKQAMHLLGYLKRFPAQGLAFSKSLSSCATLRIFCDSDWATCPRTRRSCTGYVVLLGFTPIAWRSRMQHTVAVSSAEAEIMSMIDAVKTALSLRVLLQELGHQQTAATSIYCDSESALKSIASPNLTSNLRHIAIRIARIKIEVHAGNIALFHVAGKTNPADPFTKVMSATSMNTYRDVLMSTNPSKTTSPEDLISKVISAARSFQVVSAHDQVVSETIRSNSQCGGNQSIT